jgi:DNA-binding NtrC family response regulator
VSKKHDTVSATPPPPRILLLDHVTSSLRALVATLEREGFAVDQTDEPAQALDWLRAGSCAVVLGELSLAADDLLGELSALPAGPPLIVFDDFQALDTAPARLRAATFESLARPLPDGEVLRAVRRALESQTLRAQNRTLRQELGRSADFGTLVSSDARMRRIFETLASLADSRATLLFGGESGTGKTQLAHGVHQASARASGPFVEVNCGALPSSLLESELFGHVRGAFTGAVKDRAGKFEQAAGGTILLDEIGTAPHELQVKLLRVLEEGRFERVGDTRTRTVDARVIAATNVDLAAEVAAGRFRADLYYRIHVLAIDVPPLRERVSDVPLLAERFRERFARLHGRRIERIAPAALESLCRHPWPGNVRELENTLERAVLVARGTDLEPADLWSEGGPARATLPSPGTSPAFEGWESGPPQALKAALEAPERWLLLRALERHRGNRNETARFLAINRATLFNKMRKYGLLSFPSGVEVPPSPASGPRSSRE